MSASSRSSVMMVATTPPPPPGYDERRRRERPVWWGAVGVSLAIHAVVFLAWPSTTVLISPFAAEGPRSGDDQAAGGSMQAINLPPPPPRVELPLPVPTPTVEPVVEVEFDDDVRVQPSEMAGSGLADLAPPGPGTGRGSGDGGTSDAGRFTVTPPAPRALILPTFADELKERGAEIWVWVDVTGRVVPDSTRLRPPTSDRGLNQRLRDEAADWRFEPARRGDEAVASWYNYRVRTGG